MKRAAYPIIIFCLAGLLIGLASWIQIKKPVFDWNSKKTDSFSLPADPLANTYFISIQNQQFSPESTQIFVGQSLTFINNDNADHEIISDSKEFDSGLIQPGASAEIYFTDPGTYRFHSKFDSDIRGKVSVEIPN